MLKELDLKDPTQGVIRLLITTSTDEAPWGDLEPLRGTSWAVGVTEIKGESLSHALHGWITPLQREMGRSPKVSATRITVAEGRCSLCAECLGWDPNVCRPGGKKPNKKEIGPPACYESPMKNPVFDRVAAAWKEDRHTVVVIGSEFSLT